MGRLVYIADTEEDQEWLRVALAQRQWACTTSVEAPQAHADADTIAAHVLEDKKEVAKTTDDLPRCTICNKVLGKAQASATMKAFKEHRCSDHAKPERMWAENQKSEPPAATPPEPAKTPTVELDESDPFADPPPAPVIQKAAETANRPSTMNAEEAAALEKQQRATLIGNVRKGLAELRAPDLIWAWEEHMTKHYGPRVEDLITGDLASLGNELHEAGRAKFEKRNPFPDGFVGGQSVIDFAPALARDVIAKARIRLSFEIAALGDKQKAYLFARVKEHGADPAHMLSWPEKAVGAALTMIDNTRATNKIPALPAEVQAKLDEALRHVDGRLDAILEWKCWNELGAPAHAAQTDPGAIETPPPPDDDDDPFRDL